MASAGCRARRSRSRRRRTDSESSATSRGDGGEGTVQEAVLVAPVHAGALLDGGSFAELGGGAEDEALGQGAELPLRVVSEGEGAVGDVFEAEGGHVGPRVQLANLGMDDVVERQQERLGRRVRLEEEGVAGGQQRDGG